MASNTGKKARHDDDRISNLPDSILSRILWRLPIKDAVSTSILSTRWRYLFVSMFNLDVDFLMFGSPPPHTVKSFMNFMDKMLFFHTEERIEQFRLNHIDIPGMDVSRVCGWVSAALWRGVKDIDLVFGFNSNPFPRLPTALLFTSKTLVRLKLVLRVTMEPVAVPVNVCLPCLKTLELTLVRFEDDGSVKRLLSSCPVLEHLSISPCDIRNVTCLKISHPSLKSLTLHSLSSSLGFVIDVPSVVYFKYEGFRAKNYSMDMPSLVTADIDISLGGFVREIIHHRHGLDELFDGLGNVRSLRLRVYPEALPFLSHKRFAAFQNLLHLQILDWTKEWKGVGLYEFLEFSPNLQTLVISNVSNEMPVPMEKVPSCVAYRLKELKVIDFDNESSLFKMVTYILINATVLEKLTIRTSQVPTVEEKFKITKQLLGLPRSSIKCQLMTF